MITDGPAKVSFKNTLSLEIMLTQINRSYLQKTTKNKGNCSSGTSMSKNLKKAYSFIHFFLLNICKYD